MVLETPSDTINARGEAIPAWTTVTTVWGSIEPLVGREGFAAQQMYASATSLVTIRYRAGVVPKMRFRKGSRVFDIDFPQNVDERNTELRCICTERNL